MEPGTPSKACQINGEVESDHKHLEIILKTASTWHQGKATENDHISTKIYVYSINIVYHTAAGKYLTIADTMFRALLATIQTFVKLLIKCHIVYYCTN